MTAASPSSRVTLFVRPATPVDLGAIRDLLEKAGLPTEGVAEHLHHILVGEVGPTVVATAGIEVCGAAGLLRSVAVNPSHRGQGRGIEVVRAALSRADSLGLGPLYLLTTTAAPFFERFGFRTISRTDAPASIQQTREFSSLCPESAVLMRRSV